MPAIVWRLYRLAAEQIVEAERLAREWAAAHPREP